MDWQKFDDDRKKPMPVEGSRMVEVQIRDGTIFKGRADSFYWNLGPCAVDIVGYRDAE